MLRIRVFIACSGPAVPLAEALSDLLEGAIQTGASETGATAAVKNNKDGAELPVEWTVTKWWQRTTGLGGPILDMLKTEAEKATLAVTLLTEDDLILAAAGPVLVARDNCIFEAGLFMGALGLKGNRSVLVSSVSKVPGDLAGVKLLPMPKATPKQLKNKTWCEETMKTVARDLTQHAWNQLNTAVKRPVLGVLSADELFEREKPRAEGGDLNPEAIVINTLQPAEEKDIERARQVVKNMEAGVTYLYFFRADVVHVPKVINLVESLVIATLTKQRSVRDSHRDRIIQQNLSKVPEKLRTIQRRLFIHFLPNERAPLLFCVHNAASVDSAKCYLRDSTQERFFEWGDQSTAFDVARDLSRLRHRPDDPAVFYPTDLYKLYDDDGREIRNALERALRSSFGESEEIRKLCFLEPETVKAIEAPSISVTNILPQPI